MSSVLNLSPTGTTACRFGQLPLFKPYCGGKNFLNLLNDPKLINLDENVTILLTSGRK